MANFNDFLKDDKNKCESKVKVETATSDNRNKKLEETINQYQKLTSDELMQEFIKLTIEKKNNGELSQDELSNIKNTILPFLNEEQKQSLEKILKVVENV